MTPESSFFTKSIKLTIVIPTYNRSSQIEPTLLSIARSMNDNLTGYVQVILVDNNSTHEDRKCYADLVEKISNQLNIKYFFESRQGRSHACNAGAREAMSDWIAFIDDDETLSAQWLATALSLIKSDGFSYFGGHVLPDWERLPPSWLPIHQGKYRGVLGWIELSQVTKSYDDFDASLCGGNMIVNREIFFKIGGFSSALGRGSKNLLGGEDGEFHRRLKKSGAKGLYCPELIVRHWIPVSRMTVEYHWRWAYWSGVSNRIRIITHPQTAENFPRIFGIPRYRFAKGLQGLGQYFTAALTRRLYKTPDGVVGLLDFMYLIGLLRGKAEGRKLGFNMKPSDVNQ